MKDAAYLKLEIGSVSFENVAVIAANRSDCGDDPQALL